MVSPPEVFEMCSISGFDTFGKTGFLPCSFLEIPEVAVFMETTSKLQPLKGKLSDPCKSSWVCLQIGKLSFWVVCLCLRFQTSSRRLPSDKERISNLLLTPSVVYSFLVSSPFYLLTLVKRTEIGEDRKNRDSSTENTQVKGS